MRVSMTRKALVVIGGLVAAALVAVTVIVTGDDSDELVGQPAASRGRPVDQPVEVIASRTPARSAIGVSQRLFEAAPVVVLADADDPAAQRTAIASATTLDAPVLIDHAQAPAEIDRLGARTVLTFGRTREVVGARGVPVDADRAAAQVAAIRRTGATTRPPQVDMIVLTRSRTANAAAVATARIAGADVLQIRSADPRRSPRAAKVLTSRPDTPVLALGTPFRDLRYTLAVVRNEVEQPTGGYLALPRKHYTALYGHPGAPALGVLGEQGVKASVRRVERLARSYAKISRSEFVPTFEIIATVATASAGEDKDYSREASVTALRPLVDAAEKAGVYVILDLQPGRTDFLTQAKRYRSLLERPHVGLALDPEWRLAKRQKHLRQIGSVGTKEINRVADWLARMTRREVLPQKLFVLHQFAPMMIKGRSRLDTSHAELATVIHVDGHGTLGAKLGTWRGLRRGAPIGVHWGWKNFHDEDVRMLSPRKTWRRVKPHPGLITYQ